VREVARVVRARAPRALLHVDAVQALGKLELSLAALGCDTLALSAHKLGGPQGAGALIVREGVELEPLVHGGGQEGGLRSGTENVAALVGFGAAAELAEAERPANAARMRALRDRLVRGLADVAGARVIGAEWPEEARAPHVVAVVLPGAPSEVRMHHLEQQGVLVSAGSACQAKKSAISPALTAHGLAPELARSLLRVSFGADTTPEHVDALLAALAAVERKLAPAPR
jgi:cysteine desulfurase